MGGKRIPYDRKPTKPLPREELAPIERALTSDESEDTKARCPLCMGSGMVPVEIASTFECLCAKAKEQT